MTLEKANSIATHITNVFANKSGKDVFYRRSQLRGYTFIEISHAFALVIAGRRQIVGANPEMKEHCFKCAELIDGLISSSSFRMRIIPDEDAEKIERLERNSPDYNRQFLKIFNGNLDNTDPEWDELSKEETPSSFNLFCWTLNHEDPLYWQKVYTHLGLQYDENTRRAVEGKGEAFKTF